VDLTTTVALGLLPTLLICAAQLENMRIPQDVGIDAYNESIIHPYPDS
jgi:hypothetical protein